MRLKATAGEWVQGWISGREALVSLVVDWESSVELVPRHGSECRLQEKSLRAFELARSRVGQDDRGLSLLYPCINNPVPVAKGFASSTMDVAGVLAVCLSHCGQEPSPEELFYLSSTIEPSDGIMFEQLALVDHLRGELLEHLAPPPPLQLAVIVPERGIDTIKYRESADRLDKLYTLAYEQNVAYTLLRSGLTKGSVVEIAEAATLSAVLQQELIPSLEWEILCRARRRFNALGIAAAHSGSASSLIFQPCDRERAIAAGIWISGQSDHKLDYMIASASGGGIKYYNKKGTL